MSSHPRQLLTAHFVRRLIDDDLISPDADRHESLSMFGAMLVSLGLFVSVLVSTKYLFNPYLLSGTLSYVVHAVRYRSNQFAEVEKTWDATVVIVFDGTATPELTVNGVFHYRLNLVSGVVARS